MKTKAYILANNNKFQLLKSYEVSQTGNHDTIFYDLPDLNQAKRLYFLSDLELFSYCPNIPQKNLDGIKTICYLKEVLQGFESINLKLENRQIFKCIIERCETDLFIGKQNEYVNIDLILTFCDSKPSYLVEKWGTKFGVVIGNCDFRGDLIKKISNIVDMPIIRIPIDPRLLAMEINSYSEETNLLQTLLSFKNQVNGKFLSDMPNINYQVEKNEKIKAEYDTIKYELKERINKEGNLKLQISRLKSELQNKNKRLEEFKDLNALLSQKLNNLKGRTLRDRLRRLFNAY